MIVTLDTKRRLTVPAALAPASPGDYFDARFDAEEDAFVFRRLAGKENWLTVLKACPVSPDDVPPRARAPPQAMSWLLETDVICQPAKRHGDARVIAWLENGAGPLLHERRGHCATGILGALLGRASASGPSSLANAASGRPPGAYSRVQRVSRPRLGGPGTIARQSRSAHACRRQLHRGHRPAAWFNDCHRQRSGLQASRT
jgi:hypothetical protein